jgi:FtsP/CotA-like multicopper oxidase with cupredoxin domain
VGLGAAVAAGAALVDSGWLDRARVATAAGAPLSEPAVIQSQNGVLNLALEAKIAAASVGGNTRNVWVYNGSFPGPTLRVKPGDQLKISFKNNLPEPTNLHYHGLHASPSGIADNVFIHVGSIGGTQNYVVDVPANHPGGLNWYHPHAHEFGTQQMFGGLAGALIVTGGLDNLPIFKTIPERLMVLQSTQFTNTGDVAVFGPGTGDPADNENLINGQLEPSISIREDEWQRWRILNATVNVVYELTLGGHSFKQVAMDGHPMGKTLDTAKLLLVPGQRAEVLVKGGPAGTYDLNGRILQRPGGPTTIKLGTLDVRPARTLCPCPDIGPDLVAFTDLSKASVDKQRTLKFDFNGNTSDFEIDGKVFDENRVDQCVQLNAVEEWTIVNEQEGPPAIPHPFHIHTNSFQVTKVNGVAVPVLGFQDTINVAGGTSVTIRMKFEDFVGKSVYHCHIIPHADRGMMGRFDIQNTPCAMVQSPTDETDGVAWLADSVEQDPALTCRLPGD